MRMHILPICFCTCVILGGAHTGPAKAAQLAVPAPAALPGLVLDGWEMRDGKLLVPDTPGTGFDVEPKIFAQGRQDRQGFDVAL